jgi:hypothetical protein
LEDFVRGPCKFKKTDLTRAAKAVQAAGLAVVLIEITPDGLIRVVPGRLDEAVNDRSNPWDAVLNDDAEQKRPA